MLVSKLLMKYCESIGFENYLRRLIKPMLIVLVLSLGFCGYTEFKEFSFKTDGIAMFFQHVGYTLLLSYVITMCVPAVEDFIACRKNEIRPFFINVHTNRVYTKVSPFEMMAWIIRFSFILALSMTFVYSIPATLLMKKLKNKKAAKNSDNEAE